MVELQAALQKRRKMEEGAIWASEIAPHLYLGRGQDAKNLKQLQSHGIMHILNVADDVETFHPSLFTYANLNVTDFGGDKGIQRVFPLARDFVKSAFDGEGNNVLVHCANGSNRSATVDIALLMMLPLVGSDERSSGKKSGRSPGTGQTSSEMTSEHTPGADSGHLDPSEKETKSEVISATKTDSLLKMDLSGTEKTTKRSSQMETGTMSSEKTLGLDLKDAYRHVKMRHSATTPLRDNRAQLVMFEKELRGSCSMGEEEFKSLGLLIQVSLPCLLYAPGPSQMTLKGGTNAEFAPQIDYTTVFKPIAEKMGVHFDCDIRKRGYFPKGGGEVRVTTTPVKHLQPITMTDPGHVTKITGTAFVAGVLPIKMAQAMARSATYLLRKKYRDINVKIDAIKEQQHAAVGNGSGIIVIAETSTGCLLAGSSLGKRGVQAEEVGRQAAQMLLDNLQHGGCVDEHLQDQLIIFMALASGTSRIRSGPITLHTETAIHVAKQLTKATFNITPAGDGNAPEAQIIECTGIGLENKHL